MPVSAVSTYAPFQGMTEQTDELGKEAFLKLLTTQLAHQNPLEPASDVEFISQLTEFASLEQLRSVNDNLGIIELYQLSLNNSNALNILGKSVKIATRDIQHESGEDHLFTFTAPPDAVNTEITITDDDGKVIYQQSYPGGMTDDQEFTWHGVDSSGNTVDDGQYHIKVESENADGNAFSIPVYQVRRVDGLAYENGAIYVVIGEERLLLENVSEVYERKNTSPIKMGKAPMGLPSPYSTLPDYLLRRY